MAVVRLGTCSWADEGLLKNWYPREVRTAEGRLRHYAEWFDTVEVDSPFYRLPTPETAARWAERTPSEFVFHAIHMTQRVMGKEPPREGASPNGTTSRPRASRSCGVLLQYHRA